MCVSVWESKSKKINKFSKTSGCTEKNDTKQRFVAENEDNSNKDNEIICISN